jgi:Subtilase family
MRIRKVFRLMTFVCLMGLTGLAGSAAPLYEIRLIERTWTPPDGVSSTAASALQAQAAATGQTTVHALAQLYNVPDDSQRAALASAGLDLGAFIPGNAWIAAIPVGQITTVTQRPEIRWIEPWTGSHKLHPRLAAGDVASWARNPERPGWIMTMVLLHHDVDLARGAALAEKVGAVAMEPIEGLHGLTVWLPSGQIQALAAEEEVLWIQEGPPPLTPNNDGFRIQTRANTVNSSPYDLDGKGVRLFVYDGGRVLASHETFDPGTGSRVTYLDNSPIHEHPTHVAGTAAGDGSGSVGGRGRGVAPGASILSAGYEWFSNGMIFWDDAGDIEADYVTARNQYNADLGTNSIGSNTAANGYPCDREGDYGVSSSLLDAIVRGDDASIAGPMIMTWSAGNERGYVTCGTNYHTTGEPACAKNPIHVGAINSDGGAMTEFSSWGPCDDGRLKPIVVAPGCETGRVTGEEGIYSSVDYDDSSYDVFCGTSMATPGVAGIVSLLLQDWRQHLIVPFVIGGGTPRLAPAQVKAALIHTSRDLGPDGPDYRFGYGAVEARALIDFERVAGGLGASSLKQWGTNSVSNGQMDSFTITVPATGIGELRASLAWDDAAAAAFAADALVNDLDLELVAPDNTVYRPWVLDPANPTQPAAAGVNSLDNQEQVVVKSPMAGVWTVRVVGTSVPTGPQSYGLAISANARVFADTGCTTTASTFEAGNDGWTFSGGAARAAAPAPGHGSFSARFGGVNSAVHEVSRSFAIAPHSASRLSFDVQMTTTEGSFTWLQDRLTLEVRDNISANVLAVTDFYNNGDATGTWLQQRNIDLSPWAGTTVRLVFRVTTDSSAPTTFWVDDVNLTSCPTGASTVRLTFLSNAFQDGHVIESTETSSAGGTAIAASSTLLLGDSSTDQQVKGLVSFDTSAIPDGATIVSARLLLRRESVVGTNPFTTHGVCRVDVRTGGFNNNTALESADFQATPSQFVASILSNPVSDGSWSEGTLDADGLAAINKIGVTQLRLYFVSDDDDLTWDALAFNAGDDPTSSLRPKLEVTYLP